MGLTDGTQYFFHVFATNSAGDGPVSNEDSATPETPVPPTPPATVPDAPMAIAGTPRPNLVVDWHWEIPDDNNGAQVTSYTFQWRLDGQPWSGNQTTGITTTYFTQTLPNATNGVQARVLAVNSVGNSPYVTSSVIAASALQPPPQQSHNFTATQTWAWPYDHAERAALVLTAEGGAPTRDMGSDIDLGAGAWTGACSDGTTLWFVDTNSTSATAYTASTSARNSAFDINLGSASWQGAASDGTTLWFIEFQTSVAHAFTASTRRAMSPLISACHRALLVRRQMARLSGL